MIITHANNAFLVYIYSSILLVLGVIKYPVIKAGPTLPGTLLWGVTVRVGPETLGHCPSEPDKRLYSDSA